MENISSKQVLVVDDEDDVLRFLSMVLEDAGFKVATATSGVEGLEKIKADPPDLISLDIVMPKGSGVKLFRELKKDPELSKIPVMVVTGHARDEFGKADFTEMTMSGPGVYLEKPLNAETYIAAVNKILGTEKGHEKSEDDLKDKISSMMDSASPDTLKEIINLIQKRK
jgi:CheY-like chemotaxis protein